MQPDPPAACIDASVGAKWFLRDEDGAAEAVALLDLLGSGHLSIVVPLLFYYEMGNILAVAARRSRVAPATAVAAVCQLGRLHLRVTPADGQLLPAMAFAQQLGLSFYDATYLAAAEAAGVPLVTCDRQLIQAAAAKLDWVLSPCAALARFAGTADPTVPYPR